MVNGTIKIQKKNIFLDMDIGRAISLEYCVIEYHQTSQLRKFCSHPELSLTLNLENLGWMLRENCESQGILVPVLMK